jgi:4-amino-4-deoxy-L-arabinose transferase-like glycosyltransferase
VLQLVGLVGIAIGVGVLFSWPVGLVVAGIEAVLVGFILERENARKPI